MSAFLTVDQPTESRPRSQMRRREVPYYHRHAVHRSTLADWLTAAAFAAFGLWCVMTFGPVL